jgi:homogentisate 1,2-dioxygenase
MTIAENYLTGFGNHFQSEAIKNALPQNQNSPQKVPFGLYAEQLSGSAFTMPRSLNLHTWLYRIHPSVLHNEFQPYTQELFTRPNLNDVTPPTQMRWNPIPYPKTPTHFIDSIMTIAENGSLAMQNGASIHLYAATKSMDNCYFYNSDGDLLIVPQEGSLIIKTELGIIDLKPSEIAVIPRGIKFQVILPDHKARGYVCENYGLPFNLPELGIIGANGLAHARHFKSPVANFENLEGDFQLLTKFQGSLWSTDIKHSPLNVVAWHGNYAPYKYDLTQFNTINTVSYDHPDPSIFTVLTSPSNTPGIASLDFAIFPPRWMVATHTFRPPYFHRNIMNEYMGLIHGVYDAKETGFIPGGGSLHNCMSAHGPDADAFEKAANSTLQPEYYKDTLAFMFESQLTWRLTSFALTTDTRQKDYLACWQGLKNHFQTPHL